MKLNEDHIAALFVFVEKKRVRFYDLQVELVDHLASMIEADMEKNKSLSFEGALNYAYASFGLFGFAKIVQEKQIALEKKYKKIWWSHTKELFNWPEILLTLLIFLISYSFVKWTDIVTATTVFIAVWFTGLIYILRKLKSPRKKAKLLMLSYNPPSIFLFTWIYQAAWSLAFIPLYSWVCVSQIFIGTILLLINYRIVLKIKHEAETMYPELFLREV